MSRFPTQRTFVLGLVIEGQRLCTALDTQHTSRVTSVGLVGCDCQLRSASQYKRDGTNNVDFVISEETDTCGTARDLLLVLGICRGKFVSHVPLA